MTENELLLQSFRDIQSLKEGVHTYAYNTGEWIEIAVDDYDFYRDNEDFKSLKTRIRNDFMTNFQIKVIFVYCPYSDAAAKRITGKGNEIIKDD